MLPPVLRISAVLAPIGRNTATACSPRTEMRPSDRRARLVYSPRRFCDGPAGASKMRDSPCPLVLEIALPVGVNPKPALGHKVCASLARNGNSSVTSKRAKNFEAQHDPQPCRPAPTQIQAAANTQDRRAAALRQPSARCASIALAVTRAPSLALLPQRIDARAIALSPRATTTAVRSSRRTTSRRQASAAPTASVAATATAGCLRAYALAY